MLPTKLASNFARFFNYLYLVLSIVMRPPCIQHTIQVSRNKDNVICLTKQQVDILRCVYTNRDNIEDSTLGYDLEPVSEQVTIPLNSCSDGGHVVTSQELNDCSDAPVMRNENCQEGLSSRCQRTIKLSQRLHDYVLS